MLHLESQVLGRFKLETEMHFSAEKLHGRRLLSILPTGEQRVEDDNLPS